MRHLSVSLATLALAAAWNGAHADPGHDLLYRYPATPGDAAIAKTCANLPGDADQLAVVRIAYKQIVPAPGPLGWFRPGKSLVRFQLAGGGGSGASAWRDGNQQIAGGGGGGGGSLTVPSNPVTLMTDDVLEITLGCGGREASTSGGHNGGATQIRLLRGGKVILEAQAKGGLGGGRGSQTTVGAGGGSGSDGIGGAGGMGGGPADTRAQATAGGGNGQGALGGLAGRAHSSEHWAAGGGGGGAGFGPGGCGATFDAPLDPQRCPPTPGRDAVSAGLGVDGGGGGGGRAVNPDQAAGPGNPTLGARGGDGVVVLFLESK